MAKLGDGERHLAADVIEAAFRDMRADHPLRSLYIKNRQQRSREHFGHRVRAAAWLASKAATPWFEAAGLDQMHALERGQWSITAAFLWGKIQRYSIDYITKADIEPQHMRLLREGLAHLNQVAA